ncbi:hypothetical protein ENUP19_0121G0193 [Entamoeba nuttalli]|uniref:Poly A polymerase head domain-containing protein n=1 Tax=Entamoeba nuttalli TaxID=412467 RepID=A0ABQ0DIZ6_9EUKA
MENTPSIHLTQNEVMVFDLLKQTVLHFKLSTIIRVVGGWVRDKLLGKESHDIDITVDNMQSYQFSQYLQKYINEHTQHNVSGIGVIHKNHSAGKHLETATLRIDNIAIDICRLRASDYCDNDEEKIGTPLEDAQRRDFTINAMFYRVNDDQIEDLTGCGLNDLKSRIIRTPISPKETLHDDPARALRAIRFSGKMGFVLDEELEQEMKTKYIGDKMTSGLSRERLGRELIGMIQSDRPAYCIDQIRQFGYFKGLFGDLDEITTTNVVRSYEMYAQKFGAFELGRREIGFLAALLYSVTRETNQKKRMAKIHSVIIDSLKLSVKERNNIILVHNGVKELEQLSNKKEWTRVEVGRIVVASAEWWKESICLSCAIHAPCDGVLVSPYDKGVMNKTMVEWCNLLLNKIASEELENIWQMKPLVNGEECSKLLQRKGGPWLKEILKDMIELQIEKPMITKDEVVVFVLKWGQ